MKTALLYALLVAGQAADVVTTCHGLNAGLVEQHPLLGQSCLSVATRKAALTGATVAVFPWLRKRHPRLAVGLILIPAATGFAGAAINISVMR